MGKAQNKDNFFTIPVDILICFFFLILISQQVFVVLKPFSFVRKRIKCLSNIRDSSVSERYLGGSSNIKGLRTEW